MASVFTKIIKGEIPSYKIAENDKFFAFLDINPVAVGHTLVVPKLEIDYLFDIDNQLYAELVVYAKQIAVALHKTIQCIRVGMLVVGTEVPHAHIHLIPFISENQVCLSAPKIVLSQDEMINIQNDIIKHL
ncbi:MAG: HIT domain-containing protein [Bacteroidales bacterium]|nr:HIT domain-containing protein [Bacteroidales bacterium]